MRFLMTCGCGRKRAASWRVTCVTMGHQGARQAGGHAVKWQASQKQELPVQ